VHNNDPTLCIVPSALSAATDTSDVIPPQRLMLGERCRCFISSLLDDTAALALADTRKAVSAGGTAIQLRLHLLSPTASSSEPRSAANVAATQPAQSTPPTRAHCSLMRHAVKARTFG
jgi:hypothetical protein